MSSATCRSPNPKGAVHTSSAAVTVLPEADEVEVDIADADLRIDVYRSTGPGGQSVNTTDSAVRITHLPTGTVVAMQDEKSQIQNRAKALVVLRARLLKLEQDKQADELSRARREQVGSGGRSDKIRTYNFKENRVTDHRINLTLHKLDRVLQGDLDELVDALLADERATAALSAKGERCGGVSSLDGAERDQARRDRSGFVVYSSRWSGLRRRSYVPHSRCSPTRLIPLKSSIAASAKIAEHASKQASRSSTCSGGWGFLHALDLWVDSVALIPAAGDRERRRARALAELDPVRPVGERGALALDLGVRVRGDRVRFVG